jgi:hypothetical protein
MLKRGRFILYIDWQRATDLQIEDLREAIDAGARVIVATHGPLPPELKDFSVMTPSTATDVNP